MKTNKGTLSIFFIALLINIGNFYADTKKETNTTEDSYKKTKSADLKQMLTQKTPAWELTVEQFEKKWKPFFKWLNKTKKTAARFQAINSPYKLTIAGLPVWETVIRFKENKFKRMEVSLYNRGDASVSQRMIQNGTELKKMTSSQFKDLIKLINDKMNEWIQVKGKALPPKKLIGGSNDLIYEKYWVKGEECAGLQWSITKLGNTFEPEYMKFIYSKYDSHNDPRKMMTRNRNAGKLNNAGKLKDNVKTKDGFKYIDNIPMVDQGPKGYCAVAATERVLKYYGSNVDQHEIAQLVDTTYGTNPVHMIKMLKRATPKLGLKILTYLDPPDFSKGYGGRDTRDYIKEIDGFNKILKKQGLSQLPLMYPIVAQIEGQRLTLFKEYKCNKHKTEFKRFKSNIKKNIDKGIPVVWGLFLGVVPENGKTPQSRGGHMRLIIGYNKDLSQLVFTDTWGAGHEFKTINSDDAWIVTSFYGVFKPSKK